MFVFCHPVHQQEHFSPPICLCSTVAILLNNGECRFVQVKPVKADWRLKSLLTSGVCHCTGPPPFSYLHMHTKGYADALISKV